MSIENRKHIQKHSHPFRRFIPTTEENARDEFFVITHANIIANLGGGAHRTKGGGGQ